MGILDETIDIEGTAEFICECNAITTAKWTETDLDSHGPIVEAKVSPGCSCIDWDLEATDRIFDWLIDEGHDDRDYSYFDAHCDDLDDPY